MNRQVLNLCGFVEGALLIPSNVPTGFAPSGGMWGCCRSFSARAPAALPVAFLTRPFLISTDHLLGRHAYNGSPLSREDLVFFGTWDPVPDVLGSISSSMFWKENLLEVQLNGVIV